MTYRTLFYVNIYGSYKLSKTVQFFWPTLYIYCHLQYLEMQRQNRKLCNFKIANDAVCARCRDDHKHFVIQKQQSRLTDMARQTSNNYPYIISQITLWSTRSILIHMEYKFHSLSQMAQSNWKTRIISNGICYSILHKNRHITCCYVHRNALQWMQIYSHAMEAAGHSKHQLSQAQILSNIWRKYEEIQLKTTTLQMMK